MSQNTNNQDPFSPKQELPVDGAFEIFDGNRENLITLTRTGRLLQPGDFLPAVPGIEADGKPLILHTVNAFGTETCDTCTNELESFQNAHPEIRVVSVTKQTAEEMQAVDDKRADEGKPAVTHTRVSIDQESAIDLGVALAPGEGADTTFWPAALRRTVALVDAGGQILAIQQHDDQEQMPDFDPIFAAAEALK